MYNMAIDFDSSLHDIFVLPKLGTFGHYTLLGTSILNLRHIGSVEQFQTIHAIKSSKFITISQFVL